MNQSPDQPFVASPAEAPVASEADHGLFLYTGKPITAEEQEQFIESAAKTLLGPGATAKSPERKGKSYAGSLSSSAVTLTPANFAVSGIHGIANSSRIYDSALDILSFTPTTYDRFKSDQSCLTLWIDIDKSNPGTLYTIFVHADAYSPNPKFEITFQARLVQTMSGTERMNQFAYPFTCGDSDAALITIYCSAEWAFKSAMLITSTI